MINETIEGNKLIAEFMGWEWHDEYVAYGMVHPRGYYSGDIAKDGVFGIEPHLLKFHSSWDWLMPAVERIHINRAVKAVSIIPGKTRIWFKPDLHKSYIQSPHKPENSSITECWYAVIEFIKWYNQQKPKP